MDVRASYDSAAAAYAAQLSDELTHKPLDRHLLDRFAESVRGRGLVADIGCGPGHVARYLHTRGVPMLGIDVSPAMIQLAAAAHPLIEFRVGDMLAPGFRDGSPGTSPTAAAAMAVAEGSLAGLVAFYAIVHFDEDQVRAAAREFRRVLAPGGLALVAFHIGDDTIHVDDLFGARVDLDFRFHPTGSVVSALEAAGLSVIERTERAPYPGVEHQSRRAYLLAKAV